MTMPASEYMPNGHIEPWDTTREPNRVSVPPQLQRNGHPRFYQITEEENDLHSMKNHDYAKGGDPLGNFNRVAKILSLYPGLDLSKPTVVALLWSLKQIDAALWALSQGFTAKVEGIRTRLKDVSVYMKLAIVMEEERERGPQEALKL